MGENEKEAKNVGEGGEESCGDDSGDSSNTKKDPSEAETGAEPMSGQVELPEIPPTEESMQEEGGAGASASGGGGGEHEPKDCKDSLEGGDGKQEATTENGVETRKGKEVTLVTAVTRSQSRRRVLSVDETVGSSSTEPPSRSGAAVPRRHGTRGATAAAAKAKDKKTENSTESAMAVEAVASEPAVENSKRDKEKPLPYEDDGTGCLVCGIDDDHANLLLCEVCNDEYHTYCLSPPLQAVPDGDFFCDKCKSQQQQNSRRQGSSSTSSSNGAAAGGSSGGDSSKPVTADDDPDGLEALVAALPPTFTARFGEICWAAGGVGFGWWPACIYDPRLTVGGARSMARKHLGRRHLVYFFECHDTPFAVLPASKLTSWEDGLLEEYDLGKTAKAIGKARMILFEHALRSAITEYDKPIEARLDWNHPAEPTGPILPTAPTSGKRSHAIETTSSRKKQRTQPPEENTASTMVDGVAAKPPRANHVGGTSANSKGTRPYLGPARRQNVQRALEALTGKSNGSHDGASSNVTNNNATGSSPVLVTGSRHEIESHEDGRLVCKILLASTPPPLSSGQPPPTAPVEPSLTVIGFTTLQSRRTATFADIRRAIHDDLDEDCLSAATPSWKFYVPNLGPVSRKQEVKLGPVWEFLKNSTCDARMGDGSMRFPLKIVLTPK